MEMEMKMEMGSYQNNTNIQITELNGLHRRVLNHANAHRKCRGINNRMHSLINVLMLIFSAAVTSLEALLDITKNEYEVQIVKISFAGIVTFLASLNSLYNNGEKAALHDYCNKSYTQLAYEIEAQIHSHNDSEYSEYLNKFAKIKSDSIGIFGFVRKIYKIE